MSTKRRLAVEFKTKGVDGVERYRIAFDGSRDVQALRTELERRSESTGLEVFVKTSDGPFQLYDEDEVDDVVSLDEMIIAVKPDVPPSPRPALPSRAQVLQAILQPRSAAPDSHSVTSKQSETWRWSGRAQETAEPSEVGWTGGPQLSHASTSTATPWLTNAGPPGLPQAKSVSDTNEKVDPSAPTPPTNAPPPTTPPDTPPAMPLMSLAYVITPLKQVYAVLHTYLKNAATAPEYKVAVFLPIFPAVVAVVQVLRSLGDVGKIYEVRVRGRGVDAQYVSAYEQFQAADRGVLVVTGVKDDIPGLTAIIQVGLSSSSRQYIERHSQPGVSDATSSLLILGNCEEAFVKQVQAENPSLDLNQHHIPSAPFRESQSRIGELMRGNIIQEDIKEQLKMGLFSYWNSYGINPKQAKYAGELKDWWRWYGMKPIPMF